MSTNNLHPHGKTFKIRLVGGKEKWNDRKWGKDKKVEG